MEKLVLFIPHQDDETNLAGNILMDLVKKYKVYVVYSSLDIDRNQAVIRKKEAIDACFVYGIVKENIIFLEFPDTPNVNKQHFFAAGDKSIVLKFEEILLSLKPEVIIGTDFDFHSDHRMVSLALDEAVYNVMNEIKTYEPIYMKGFCYETAYYGIDDYSATNLKETQIAKLPLSNVSYIWEERISLLSQEKQGSIFLKTAFKALRCHKSQYAVLQARKVINADNVFWEKRTDNLLIRNAKITASSGDPSKINDLKVIDTEDIITKNPLEIDYSKALWKPDDSDLEPWVKIKFNEEQQVTKIVIHGNPMIDYTEKCEIKIHLNEQILNVNSLEPFGQPTVLNINPVICSNIDIQFLTKTSISEIEVFQFSKLNRNILTGKQQTYLKERKYIDLIDTLLFKGFVIVEKFKRKIKYFRRKI